MSRSCLVTYTLTVGSSFMATRVPGSARLRRPWFRQLSLKWHVVLRQLGQACAQFSCGSFFSFFHLCGCSSFLSCVVTTCTELSQCWENQHEDPLLFCSHLWQIHITDRHVGRRHRGQRRSLQGECVRRPPSGVPPATICAHVGRRPRRTHVWREGEMQNKGSTVPWDSEIPDSWTCSEGCNDQQRGGDFGWRCPTLGKVLVYWEVELSVQCAEQTSKMMSLETWDFAEEWRGKSWFS